MVKHAAREESPLVTSAERAALAFQKVTTGRTFTRKLQAWLDRIRTASRLTPSTRAAGSTVTRAGRFGWRQHGYVEAPGVPV